jgi:hypothetical protein
MNRMLSVWQDQAPLVILNAVKDQVGKRESSALGIKVALGTLEAQVVRAKHGG